MTEIERRYQSFTEGFLYEHVNVPIEALYTVQMDEKYKIIAVTLNIITYFLSNLGLLKLEYF